MNPFKAAIKLTREVVAQHLESKTDTKQHLINQLVDSELSDIFEWICAEENGISDQQIRNAHEFPFNGGCDGRISCEACHGNAVVHMLVTRWDTQETKEVYACKAHMLDPGPLLDW